jgi:hypothetical protein
VSNDFETKYEELVVTLLLVKHPSFSHEDLLASHDKLKLAHEAIMSKVTSSEPHVDIFTIFQNAILPCASPSNSSTDNIATSCDELLSFPCYSNNEASTSSSTCVVTNHVEEIEELKAQVTSFKKDLVKTHEGKSKLDKMLNVQKSPNDKSGLGFICNNMKNSKIVCLKCKIEGHHVRSCLLKKKALVEKQQWKRPHVQGHDQPRVEERSLTKINQANAPIVEKSSEKKVKKKELATYAVRRSHFFFMHYGQLTRVNSTNVLNEGLRIREIGRQMNSKVRLVKIGVYRK